MHPEDIYIAFSQACGELSTFTDEGRLPAEYPAYQHDRLRESFVVLEETLRRILSTVMQPRAVSLPITKHQYGLLTAPLQDRFLLESAEFILAVRARMPNDKLRQQFCTAKVLDRKDQRTGQPAIAGYSIEFAAGGAAPSAVSLGL